MPGNGKLRVVIAGGGVAALEAMVALRRLAGEFLEIELLSPDRDFFYRPLSVGEPFGVGEVLRFDLTSLGAGMRGEASSRHPRRRLSRPAPHPNGPKRDCSTTTCS